MKLTYRQALTIAAVTQQLGNVAMPGSLVGLVVNNQREARRIGEAYEEGRRQLAEAHNIPDNPDRNYNFPQTYLDELDALLDTEIDSNISKLPEDKLLALDGVPPNLIVALDEYDMLELSKPTQPAARKRKRATK